MAQVVAYFDDDVVFEEGPFVICNARGNGWRIEVEQKGCKCPVLPDISIYRYLGESVKWPLREDAEAVCDQLNKMVKEGKIVLDENVWVVKPEHQGKDYDCLIPNNERIILKAEKRDTNDFKRWLAGRLRVDFGLTLEEALVHIDQCIEHPL